MNLVNLERLASIIREMKKPGKLQLLTLLHAQDSLDRESLDYLFDRTIAFDFLFGTLGAVELVRFLKLWSDDELACLIGKLDEDQKTTFRRVLGKEADAAILARARNPIAANTLGQLIRDRIGLGCREGWLPRGAFIDLFLDLPCSSRISVPEDSDDNTVFFRVLNPLVNAGEAIQIIIHAPQHGGRELKLIFRTDTDREPGHGGGWIRKVSLEAEGFSWVEEPVDSDQPPDAPRRTGAIDVELWVDKNRFAVRRVYALGTSRSFFRVGNIEVKIAGHGRQLTCTVSDKDKVPVKGRALALMFCPRCGGIVLHRDTEIEDGYLSLNMHPSLEKPMHPQDDLLLYLRIGEHGTLVHADLQQAVPSAPKRLEVPREMDKDLCINLPPGPPDELILVLVSESDEADRRLRCLMAGSAVGLVSHRKDTKNSPAKNMRGSPATTPLDEFAEESTLFLSQRREPVSFQVFRRPLDDRFVWSPPAGAAVPGDLHLSFYKPADFSAAAKPYPFLACRARLPESWLSIPAMTGLLEGETASVALQYRAPDASSLAIDIRRILERKPVPRAPGILARRNEEDAIRKTESIGVSESALGGTGTLEIMVGYGTGIRATLRGPDGTEFSKERYFDAPPEQTMGITYLPKGTVLVPPKCWSVQLLPGLPEVRRLILEEFLYLYPFACGEQTAARITATALLCLETADPDKKSLYQKSLDEVLLPHWKTFSRDGLFSINGSDHSPTLTRYVYANLRPLVTRRNRISQLFPELATIIQGMEEPIRLPPSPEKMADDLGWNFFFNPERTELYGELLRKSPDYLLENRQGKLEQVVTGSYLYLDTIICGLADAYLATGGSKAGISRLVAGRKQIPRHPVVRFIEDIGLIKKSYEKVSARQKMERTDYLEVLLGNLHFLKSRSVFPSTILSVSVLCLLERMAKTGRAETDGRYRYRIDEKPVQLDKPHTLGSSQSCEALSDFTFYTWTAEPSWEEVASGKGNAPIDAPSRSAYRGKDTRLQRGQTWSVDIPQEAIRQGSYLALRVPPILEPLNVRGGSWNAGTGTLLFYRPDEHRITFRAQRSGQGKVFWTVVNMYDHRSAVRNLCATLSVD